MRQFTVTTAMGKRLIGKGMAQHPDIEAVLEKGTLVIIAGTTNGYVAEEILTSLGQAEGFSREGFRRGMTVAPGAKAIHREHRTYRGILKVQTSFPAGPNLPEGGRS